MSKLMKSAGRQIDGAGASAAFKFAYIGATAFLDHKLAGS